MVNPRDVAVEHRRREEEELGIMMATTKFYMSFYQFEYDPYLHLKCTEKAKSSVFFSLQISQSVRMNLNLLKQTAGLLKLTLNSFCHDQ